MPEEVFVVPEDVAEETAVNDTRKLHAEEAKLERICGERRT